MRNVLVAAALAVCLAQPALALDKADKTMIATVDKEAARGEALLEKLVNVNSGTMNFKGVEEVGKMMRAELEELGFKVTWVPMGAANRAGHIIAEHPGPKGYKGRKMLLIGHIDTVFEPSSPFQVYRKLDATSA